MISIKNVILPNKPLNNFELEEASKKLKIKCFRGVFLLDTLPKKLNKKECGIVNYDKSGGSGTHWVVDRKCRFWSIFQNLKIERPEIVRLQIFRIPDFSERLEI